MPVVKTGTIRRGNAVGVGVGRIREMQYGQLGDSAVESRIG
jgi:hypothetical protein